MIRDYTIEHIKQHPNTMETLSLQRKYFDEIRINKTCEIRVGSQAKANKYVAGTLVCFTCGDEELPALCTQDAEHYSTLRDALALYHNEAMPWLDTPEEAAEEYARITMPNGEAVFSGMRVACKGGVVVMFIST